MKKINSTKVFDYKYYKSNKNIYYLYIHKYKNRLLYIGKGNGGRASDFNRRKSCYKEYINSVGEQNIKIYIIEESSNEQYILQLEQELHEQVLSKGYDIFSKPNKGKYGYSSGKNNPRYGKGYTMLGKNNPNAKAVNQLDMKGNFISRFDTINQASEKLGLDRHKIRKCCIGEKEFINGYKFEYAK